MEQKKNEENPLMKNPAYRHLVGERNKLLKQIISIEQRMEKYAYALGDKDLQQIQQRLDTTNSRLADVNDKMADIEEGVNTPANTHWIGNASKELVKASRKAAS